MHESSSMTSQILADVLAQLDRLNLFGNDRDEVVTPMLIMDGHDSRFFTIQNTNGQFVLVFPTQLHISKWETPMNKIEHLRWPLHLGKERFFPID